MTDEQLQRIHDIEYSCDSREELAERIVGLEDAYAQKVKSSDDYMVQLMSCEISLDGMHLIYGIMSDRYDEVIDLLRDARDEYVELRDELEQWHRLTANIELPDYPVTQFQPKDLERENVLLRTFVDQMYRDMQGVLDMSTDTVFVDSIGTLRDKMDWYMRVMAELGMPPADYESRMRELGIEVDE